MAPNLTTRNRRVSLRRLAQNAKLSVADGALPKL
jgi:hypothetical protein